MKKRYIVLSVVLILVSGVVLKVRALIAPPGSKECDPIASDQLFYTDTDHELIVAPETLTFLQRGGTVNDASCLDETAVYGVVRITSEEDISEALAFARSNNLKVSLAGAKHSMGGHAFSKGNLVLDMTEYKSVTVDEVAMTMRVESGATWHDIQNILHPRFAVKAMQSTDIFTVGGSISVNAHGMDHTAGAVENTIRSMRVMLPSGAVETVSRTQNPELYQLVVGGYGLFAIILDVELEMVPNDMYASDRIIMDYTDFPDYFAQSIEGNTDLGLMYTHLSTAPTSFLKEAIVYTYTKEQADIAPEDIPPLGEVSSVALRRLVMNASKHGPIFQQLRWWSEKYLEPKMESCSISRNSAIASGEACLVMRNEPMHDSVPYLKNSLPRETDILHEYFIPRRNLVAFIDGMRTIMTEQDVNLLNASIRVVNAEEGFLTYAPEPAFSIVLYINQATSPEGNERMAQVTRDLIDLTVQQDGRFFLPYQLHYTPEQLRASYPTIDTFFSLKQKYDPEGMLSNTWYERYGPNV